jgi:hypothetical protein
VEMDLYVSWPVSIQRESMRMNQMIYLRAAFVHINSGTAGKVPASDIYFPNVFGSRQ